MNKNKIMLSFILCICVLFIPKIGYAYTSMLIDPVYSGSTQITGIAENGTEVYLDIDGETVGYAEVYNNEYFIDVNRLNAGQDYTLYNIVDGEIYQQIDGQVKKGEKKSSLSAPSIYYRPSNTSGSIYGSATKGNTVYAYVNNKKIGSAKAGTYGDFTINISPLKSGDVVKVFQEDKYKKRSNSTYITVKQSRVKFQKQLSKKHYTEIEKSKINKEMLIWISNQAKKSKKAVTEIYFNHGAGVRGDWYAKTPAGHIQVQDLNNPGYYAFKLHSLGGVAMYTPANNKYGYSKQVSNASTAEGYSKAAKKRTYITKYMFGDNGVVYELVKKKEQSWTTSGFGQYNDNGVPGSYVPDASFKVSKDKALQKKYKEVLKKYKH